MLACPVCPVCLATRPAVRLHASISRHQKHTLELASEGSIIIVISDLDSTSVLIVIIMSLTSEPSEFYALLHKSLLLLLKADLSISIVAKGRPKASTKTNRQELVESIIG